MPTIVRDKPLVAGEPKPKKPCSLRAKIVDELWAKYEPGRKPSPPAPAPQYGGPSTIIRRFA